LSAAVRDFTAGSPIAYMPSHSGVQPLPSEITKARLYVVGDPAESVSAAVVALTYGAYEVADDFVVPGFGDAAAAFARPGSADAGSEASPPEEHPAQARATRQTTPAAGFRKLRMVRAPLLVFLHNLSRRLSREGSKHSFPDWKCVTSGADFRMEIMKGGRGRRRR